jgi:hypothetical protein
MVQHQRAGYREQRSASDGGNGEYVGCRTGEETKGDLPPREPLVFNRFCRICESIIRLRPVAIGIECWITG